MTQAESNVFAVSVMFRDQVGIVASVSAAIQKLGGNLHDVTQTVLQGYFSMLLLADMPKTVSKEEIIKALEALPELKGACFGVLPYDGPLEQSVDASLRFRLHPLEIPRSSEAARKSRLRRS